MIEKFFYEHPVFRFEEFAKWKKDNASDTETAVYQSIHYYIQTKRIIRIKKALYAVIPPNETEESVSVDPYLIAGKASEDSVLGFHTAMELYGMAYSVFQQFYFLSQQKIKPFIFSDQYFQPVSLSKNLLKADKQQLEVDVINREGVNIKITSIERTFVDVLDRITLNGGLEEVIRSLEAVGVLNIDRVINYSLALGKAVLNAKVGWCLEQRQGAFAPTEKQLQRLLDKKPTVPRHTAKTGSEPFKLIKKWNILLPVSVIDKTWEEPSHDV